MRFFCFSNNNIIDVRCFCNCICVFVRFTTKMFECRALGLSNVQIQTNVRRKQNTMNCHLVLLRASNNQCAAFCITKTEKTSNFYHVQSTSFAMYEIVGDNAIRLHFVKSTILCNSTQKDE